MTAAPYAYCEDTEQLDYVSVPPIQSHRLTVTPAETQARPTIQSIVRDAAHAGAAQAAETLKPQIHPKKRSGWASTATWLVIGQLGLTGLALAKGASDRVTEILAGGSALTVANHGRNSRKLKTAGAPNPKNYALLKFGGGNTEIKS